MEANADLGASDRALEILLNKLEEAKARNASLSLRAFAQRLGMSSGALSEMLSGKRPLSNAVKRRIAAKLMLSPQETLEFFKVDLPGKMGFVSDARVTLSQDQFHLISDWWYFGILNLVNTRGFKNQTTWIAKRLGLTAHVVIEALERLFRLGYLEKNKSQIVRKVGNFRTTDDLRDLSIRKSHIEDLKLIDASIREVPIELRDNTSCSFVIDRADLPKAKELIRIFQSQFLNQVSKDTGDEVYKITVALYPLTKVTGDQ